MAVPVTVPRLGWSMDEGTFLEWLKRDGDEVRPGEPLFVLESEKAAENIESLDAGILRIGNDSPAPGTTVRVGQVLAYLVAAGEIVPTVETSNADPQVASTPNVEVQRHGTVPCPAPVSPTLTHPATPRARRVARELGINWNGVHGTGRGGRIRERDVRQAAAGLPAGELVPHSHIRKLTAARMVAGVTQAAPVTLITRADATSLVEARKKLSGPDVAPSYTDLLVRLTAVALREHPQLQAQWRDDGLFVPNGVSIAIAVDTEAGLFAPVLRDAHRLSVAAIASQSRELIALARDGRLGAEMMRDATFTITNLGMFGVDSFTPIIHLPQSAVLGVGRIVREPAVVGDAIVPRWMLTLSLTFDHRVVDGAPAARFLDTLRRSIEQPIAVLKGDGE
jgi:pyruvate dehydrogenase E2 component (dihydrolipoamide acetyltransferase)